MKAAIKSWLRRSVHSRAMAGRPPARVPWGHWGYVAGEDGLSLHGVSMGALANNHGSPLHVLNVPRLLTHLDALMAGSGTLRPTVCCSVKTYPLPGLLALLFGNSAQAEIISEHELWLVRRLGVPAKHIIFNGPAKSDASLAWAIESGVKAIHFNHFEEIERVASVAARVGKRARVGLRLTSSGVAGQFGFAVADARTLDIAKRILHDPWLELVSLHGHRGFHMRTAADVLGHVQPMLSFMAKLRQALGWSCQILDVGGSLAVPTVATLDKRATRMAWTFGVPAAAPDPVETLTPRDYSKLVCGEVERFCAEHQLVLPEVVMEPGRALSADAQALLSTVLEVRRDEPFDYAVTDVGTAVAPGARDEYHQIGLAHLSNARHAAEERVYRIVGPICHLGDVASPAWRLPVLSRGDKLLMMDSGAYFISDASSFSFPQPGVVAVFGDGRTQCLRRVETSEDIIHRDLSVP